MPSERRVPVATYRLQLRPGFGFDEAAAIVPYLAALGVSHVYCSPYLQAAPGSSHGYDQVDPTRVSDELGGEEAHRRFCRVLADHGMGQVLDIVPNHMATAPQNRWWWDVLENGPASMFGRFFDVDWDPPEAKLRDTVLLPVLDDHYGRVLEAGRLRVVREGGSFCLHFEDLVFPIAPRSIDRLLREAAERCSSPELETLAGAFGRLPHATDTDPESIRERHRDKEVLRSLLARLCDEETPVARAVDAVVEEWNRDADALDALLARQNYRPAFWRAGGRELDYRRFFDVDSLVALRMERDEVFDATHALPIAWVNEGILDGLRIDHVDGLRDPEAYLRRLNGAARRAWIVVEKILEPDEHLPASWPVDGTSGYDFAAGITALFVDAAGEQPITDLYRRFTGEERSFAEIAHSARHSVLDGTLDAEVNRLTELLVQVCESRRRHRDYTRRELRDALAELLASFGVYRTYIRPDQTSVREADAATIDAAVDEARRRRGDLDPELFTFLGSVLRLEIRGVDEEEFVLRFQQFAGSVMAKGVEDTALYRYNRFVCLNDVGCQPDRFGLDLDEFHRANVAAATDWPDRMLTTSTHDTKRSEDVRARLATLSELPDEWAAAVDRWASHNDRHRRHEVPDANTEYLLYQTLVGAHPLPVDRAVAYVMKAVKEAKVHTSWVDPDAAYERSVTKFIEEILADPGFVDDLDGFVARVVEPGRITSLAQTLCKLTAPGVPDVYQGTELWDLSLVDPDNRRPVDYDRCAALLAELDHLKIDDVWARADEGLPKLFLVQRTLRALAALRDRRVYEPLVASGPAAHHAVAFRRGELVSVAPRLVIGLERRGGWGDTTLALPAARWHNLLTDEDVDVGATGVAVGDLLSRFPVALLRQAGH